MTRGTMTCHMPRQALDVHDRQLDFEAIRPADSNFSNLPLGGARQIYTVSVSNNGRDFGSSQTYTLYNSTCFSECSDDGQLGQQKVSKFVNFSVSDFVRHQPHRQRDWVLLGYNINKKYIMIITKC